MIGEFNETSLDNKYQSAKEVVSKYIRSEQLREMIFFPLLIYGSAWENDMDFSQFAIMFKSIFLEGFSRPVGGVRTILNLLMNKFISLGGIVQYRCGVSKVLSKDGQAYGVTLENGDIVLASSILSSIGNPETMKLISSENSSARSGSMSFTETIMTYDQKPKEYGEDAAIVFYNKNSIYDYRCPDDLYDQQSAVICFSNNFSHDDFDEGIVRMTNIANYSKWKTLSKDRYQIAKDSVLTDAKSMLQQYNKSFSNDHIFHDVFTPLTVEKFTSRIGGAVYGSPDKLRTGETQLNKLYVIGTDQGFLGIVGAMLSGISMANLHVLSKS
jgi:phytoene dehydrogenase-like protein